MIRIILIVSTIVLLPSLQHFMPPLSDCLLADICNHTWIPDCGLEDHGSQPESVRMFIDICDMYEFNCDYDRKFVLTNYSECFRVPEGCPTFPKPKYLRVGNYKVMERGRHMIYAPTTPTSPVHNEKRRYNPKSTKKLKPARRSWNTLIKTPAISPTRTTRAMDTVALRRMSVLIGGRVFIKVARGSTTSASVTKPTPTKVSMTTRRRCSACSSG